MATRWTSEQKRAIEEYGGNILVSAAAGSGKTAVLIERILTIIKEKTDVDKLLIVTFTKAAAAELRERLYVALQKELDSEELTPVMAKRLARQQMLLSKSYITTIDAFCRKVVSSNPVESGFDASFRLADQGEISVLEANVLEQVLENYYKENSPEFSHLIGNFGSYKHDNELEKLILSIYKFSRSHPQPERWLVEQKESFNTDIVVDFAQTAWCKEFLKDLVVILDAQRDAFLKYYKTSEKYSIREYETMFEKDFKVVDGVTKTLKEKLNNLDKAKWDDIFYNISSLQFEKAPSMTKKVLEQYNENTLLIIEELKEKRKKACSKTKEIKEKIGKTAEVPLEDIKNVKQDMFELIDIVLEFSETYKDKKQEKHIVTFDDISHSAYDVLAETDADGNIVKSDVAKRYSEQFEEVYIDEYQDTNELQDAILYLVSRNDSKDPQKRPNMFMVGDVKQSIYGFRQARPDIFTAKYKSFAAGEKDGKLIVLNKNFRSRQGVIESVNTLFRKVMTENTCGIAYNEPEYLNFGAEYYPESIQDASTELYLVKDDADENGKEKELYEPQVVAELIKDLIDKKYQVFDKPSGKMRDIEYRDIVVLLRSPDKITGGKVYAQSMAKLGIPAYMPEKGGFFTNAEINILISFMKVIDNPLQDIHFVATMRNVYGFSENEIAKVKADNIKRAQKNEDVLSESYFEMCKNYSGNETLKEDLDKLLCRLDELRKISKHVTVSELLWQLMHENHFYEHLTKGPMGALHVANANVLYAQAIKYDSEINKGLFRFLYFFDNLKKRGDMSEATAVADGMNVVRIMSIHKSKGLEFPVVILSATGNLFNKMDLKAGVLKHRLLGLGPTCYLEEERVKYPTVMRYCVSRRIVSDMKAEELRLLYVAMTRASEKLIITGKIKKDFEEYLQEMKENCSYDTGAPLEQSVLQTERYIDWILMSGCVDAGHIHFYEKQRDEDVDDTETKKDIQKVIPKPPKTFYKQEDNSSQKGISAKISVSELKRLTAEESEELARKKHVKMEEIPDLMSVEEKTSLTAAEKGTAVHTCIQITQYDRLHNIPKEEAEEYAEELILEALDKGFLNYEQAKSVNRKMLAKFYTSELAKRIANADEIMREIPFTELEEIDGQEVAVQGVIDCVIREGSKYTVIDFKTDLVPDAQKYVKQLEYYAEAVRKVFATVPEKIVYFIKYDKQELL